MYGGGDKERGEGTSRAAETFISTNPAFLSAFFLFCTQIC